MARDLHADTAVAVQAETLAPIAMVELDFDSGLFNVWSGIGSLTWDGKTWEGIGTLGSIGSIEETTEIRAVSAQLTLSSIPPEVLAIAAAESWQQRPARIYFAVLSGREFVGEPLLVFAGQMDQMNLTEGETASISLSCESNMIDLERTKTKRWTAESQRADYPGDKGLDMVSALQEIEIKWGRE